MTATHPAAEPQGSAPGTGELVTVALGYEPAGGSNGRLWIPAGGSHHVQIAEHMRKALFAALLELALEPGARLVLLGAEVGVLGIDERAALRARVGFLPATGGLLSNLNAWENIVLPIGFHHPERLDECPEQVNALLTGLGVEPRKLLAKLPEEMTLYEKKLAGYVRSMLEAPDLLLMEDVDRGLNGGERRRAAQWATEYHAACPGGTLVHLEHAPAAD